MEFLKWREKEAERTYMYATSYMIKEMYYKCPKCGHRFDDVATIPIKCPSCSTSLNNVGTLTHKNNQDLRVKYYDMAKV